MCACHGNQKHRQRSQYELLHQDRFSGSRAPFLLDGLAQDSYPLSTRRFNLTPNEGVSSDASGKS
jgi:hypothetical protein